MSLQYIQPFIAWLAPQLPQGKLIINARSFNIYTSTHHNFDNPESTQITPVNLLSSIIPKLYANQLAYYKYNNKGYFALSLIVRIHFQLTAVAFAVVVAFWLLLCILLLSFFEVYCRLMCSESSSELRALVVVSAAHKTCLPAGIPMALGCCCSGAPWGARVERGSLCAAQGCFRYLPWVPWLVGAEFSLVFMPMNISFNWNAFITVPHSKCWHFYSLTVLPLPLLKLTSAHFWRCN